MLRLPSARGPNSMRPCIHATILWSPNCAPRRRVSSSVGQQVAEAQLAVLQHLLDLFGAVTRAQDRDRRCLTRAACRRDLMPGVVAPRRAPSRRCRPPAARRRSSSGRERSRNSPAARSWNSPPARHRFSPAAGHARARSPRRPAAARARSCGFSCSGTRPPSAQPEPLDRTSALKPP